MVAVIDFGEIIPLSFGTPLTGGGPRIALQKM
jgi:hypothetical protein